MDTGATLYTYVIVIHVELTCHSTCASLTSVSAARWLCKGPFLFTLPPAGRSRSWRYLSKFYFNRFSDFVTFLYGWTTLAGINKRKTGRSWVNYGLPGPSPSDLCPQPPVRLPPFPLLLSECSRTCWRNVSLWVFSLNHFLPFLLSALPILGSKYQNSFHFVRSNLRAACFK